MEWVAISGSWRKTSAKLEEDVRKTVQEIIARGDGIVSGGALGVDYVATDEALRLSPQADQIKIFLPTTLQAYARHYRNRANEGVITKEQAESLIAQLQKIAAVNRDALIEAKEVLVTTATYYRRNSMIVEAADKLIAFHVNESEGTKDTITKARNKGIPVVVNSYQIS